MPKKKYEDYRREIYDLDRRIASETSSDAKLQLIDENIALNQEYIYLLKKPLAAKRVGCILLSFFFLLGLVIFLPQIIIRKNRINACQRRIYSLESMKEQLTKSSF